MTDQTSVPSTNGEQTAGRKSLPVGRTLIWLGVAGASVTLSYFALRAVLRTAPPPPDETAGRIKALIDEANRLIKTLDEKKQT